MQPITTDLTTVTYKGDGDAIGDLDVERRQPGEIHAYYEPEPDERHLLPDGYVIDLGIFTEPIPPVAVQIVQGPEPEPGATLHGAIDRLHLERAMAALYVKLDRERLRPYRVTRQRFADLVGEAISQTRQPLRDDHTAAGGETGDEAASDA